MSTVYQITYADLTAFGFLVAFIGALFAIGLQYAAEGLLTLLGGALVLLFRRRASRAVVPGD